MSAQPTAAPTSGPDVDQFGKPPLGAIIFFGVVALVGLGLLLRGLTAKAVASCHGVTMAPGDTCTTGDSSRRGGTGSYTQDFQTVLDGAEGTLRGFQLGGLLVLLGALVVIALLLATWRRDRALVSALAQERPEHSHVDRGLLVPVFGGICAIALLGAGGFLFFHMQGASGMSPLWTVICAALVIVGVLALVMSRPKGATALLVYPDQLGVVNRGARSSVPFADVQYFLGDTTRSFNWVGSGRSDIMLTTDESPAFRDALAQRAHTALLQAAPQRLAQGEALDFGDITLRRDALTIAGKTISMGDVAGFRVVKDDDNTAYEVHDGAGNALGRTATSRVAHTAVLRQVLAGSGITLP